MTDDVTCRVGKGLKWSAYYFPLYQTPKIFDEQLFLILFSSEVQVASTIEKFYSLIYFFCNQKIGDYWNNSYTKLIKHKSQRQLVRHLIDFWCIIFDVHCPYRDKIESFVEFSVVENSWSFLRKVPSWLKMSRKDKLKSCRDLW